MIFKKKKQLTLEEQIDKQKKNLKKTRMLRVLTVIFITIGVVGGIDYLSQAQNQDTTVNQDVLIENRAISYIRDYYADDDDVNVSDISVDNINGDKSKVVDTSFKI